VAVQRLRLEQKDVKPSPKAGEPKYRFAKRKLDPLAALTREERAKR